MLEATDEERKKRDEGGGIKGRGRGRRKLVVAEEERLGLRGTQQFLLPGPGRAGTTTSSRPFFFDGMTHAVDSGTMSDYC